MNATVCWVDRLNYYAIVQHTFIYVRKP